MAEIDIAACLHYLVTDPEFKGSATIVDFDDWDRREWVDTRREKPTREDLEKVWSEVQATMLPVDPADALAKELAKMDSQVVSAAVAKADTLRSARG